MKGFLLDENLPARLRFKPSLPFVSTLDWGSRPSDSTVWDFARRNRLAIVSKDADFSLRIMAASPPPWVVHRRLGNLRKNDYHERLARSWPQVEFLLKSHKLVNVFPDRVEAVG